jgi:hypothetical protein
MRDPELCTKMKKIVQLEKEIMDEYKKAKIKRMTEIDL